MTTQPSTEFLSLQGAVAGRYSLERELGRGGMGVVFLARDVALERLVAIKLLPPTLALVPELRERFLREARTAARLSHPHVVPIYLVEQRDDLVYFVMAYVDGESLGQRMRRRGALPASQVGRILQEVAWALAYAHQQGVVHRDIKPDNILLEKGSDRAVVTDFGIARVAATGGVTGQGELVGTLHYMSPEQAAGRPVDGRSDLYSLGVTGFQALTGKPPYEPRNLPALIHQHLNLRTPRVARFAHRVPPELAEAVDRCLAQAPEHRFATAEDLATALGVGTPVRKDVVPEIRALLRHLRETGIAMSGLGGIVLATGMLFDEVLAQIWAAQKGNIIWFGAILGVSLLTYPIRLISMTRRAIRMGHGLSDVRAALLDQAEMLCEEQDLEGVYAAHAKRTKREAWIRRGRWLTMLGAGLLSLGAASSSLELIAMGGLSLVAGLVLLGAGPGVSEDAPAAALPLTERLMVGRLGGLLFRLAGLGLPPRPAESPTNERTETLLASAADQIFDRLPADIRRRFPTLPEAIERLEADAHALRRREEALSRAIAEVSPEGTDLAAERAGVRERLEDAVAGLEAIRLDLLRLHAGAGSLDGLTQDLEKAREINEAVNAELRGRREVEVILKSESRET